MVGSALGIVLFGTVKTGKKHVYLKRYYSFYAKNVVPVVGVELFLKTPRRHISRNN